MSIADTYMQPAISLNSRLDDQETRIPAFNAYEAFRADSTNLFPNMDAMLQAKQSQAHPIRIPVLNDGNISVSNVRSCTIPSYESESAFVTLTFFTVAVSFTMVPDQYPYNYITYEDDLAHKTLIHLRAYKNFLENLCVAQLELDKSQVNNSAVYPFLGDSMIVSALQANDFYNQLDGIMMENDIDENINIIAHTRNKALVQRLQNQGSTNAINERFQFDLNGYRYYHSRFVNNAPGIAVTGYAYPNGSLALGSWIDPSARAGHNIGTKEWTVTSGNVPLLDVPLGLYHTKDCSDQSVDNPPDQINFEGGQRMLKEGFEWSADWFIQTAYNSDPANKPGSIFKYEIAG